MRFNGTEGEEITIEEAAVMTASYRTANPGAVIANYIGKDLIRTILAQEGCMGIRTYHALNTDGSKEIVLVGCDAEGNDLLKVIVDRSIPCPNMCAKPNKLNS